VGGNITGTTIESLRLYAIAWLDHRREQAGGAELVFGRGNVGGEAQSLLARLARQIGGMGQRD
jgi:hypothetical protein